jgi:hypothetical protein
MGCSRCHVTSPVWRLHIPYATVGEDACEEIEKLEKEFEDQLEEMWL